MKIEMMCSKQDVVASLKKAAKYSHLTHLRQLAEYIQQEMELDNLKHGITLMHYELKLRYGAYVLVRIKSTYDSEKNQWETLEETVMETIDFDTLANVASEP